MKKQDGERLSGGRREEGGGRREEGGVRREEGGGRREEGGGRREEGGSHVSCSSTTWVRVAASASLKREGGILPPCTVASMGSG
jgi:hypothetical protein